MTIVQGPVREPVHQGPKKTPFYPRVEKLDIVNQWHEWKGYSSPDALYCEDQESRRTGLPQPPGHSRHGKS